MNPPGENSMATGLMLINASAPQHNVPPPPQTTHEPPNLNEMGHLKIASLNIKGANSPPMCNKRKKVIYSITRKEIAILCAVETHSDDAQIDALNRTYNPTFSFIHSHDHDHPRTRGITIITNTPLTKCSPTNIYHIIPR